MMLVVFEIMDHLIYLQLRLKYYHVGAQQLKLLREVVYIRLKFLCERKRTFAFCLCVRPTGNPTEI